jgi:outer membrane lipoprotein SlyB
MQISMRLIVLFLVALAVGCATQKPVLYPNAKYKEAGQEAAQREIEACDRMARDSGATPGGGERTARGGATGAAVGGATGAVAGAIGRRNVLDSAAAGAAVGGTAGAVHGATRSDEPSSVYQGFMNRCLRERGYEVIGWQ